MKRKTRKQDLQQRLSVIWKSSGGYLWHYEYRGKLHRYFSNDSLLYDCWKSGTETVEQLNRIAYLCRNFGIRF